LIPVLFYDGLNPLKRENLFGPFACEFYQQSGGQSKSLETGKSFRTKNWQNAREKSVSLNPLIRENPFGPVPMFNLTVDDIGLNPFKRENLFGLALNDITERKQAEVSIP